MAFERDGERRRSGQACRTSSTSLQACPRGVEQDTVECDPSKTHQCLKIMKIGAAKSPLLENIMFEPSALLKAQLSSKFRVINL